MTINTGNYNSIKPSVSLTVREVGDADFDVVYKTISNLTDALFALETLKMMNEMEEIKSSGVKSYINILEDARELLSEQISKYVVTGEID